MSNIETPMVKVTEPETPMIMEPIKDIPESPFIVEKDPSIREYLLLLVFEVEATDEDVEHEEATFHYCTGREETRETILNLLQNDNENGTHLNLFKSEVLVEGCKLEERIPIVTFLKSIAKYFDDEFDVDEYIKTYND